MYEELVNKNKDLLRSLKIFIVYYYLMKFYNLIKL